MTNDPSMTFYGLNMDEFSLDSSLTETFSNLSIVHPEDEFLDSSMIPPISFLSQLNMATFSGEPFRGSPLSGYPMVASISTSHAPRPAVASPSESPRGGARVAGPAAGGTVVDDFNIKSILPLNLNQVRSLSPKHSPQNSPGRDFDHTPYSPRGLAISPRFEELPLPTPGLQDSPRSRYLRASHSFVFTTPETLKPGSSTSPIAKDLFFVEETPNLKVKMRKGLCTNCGVTSAPEWRHGPSGRNTLCNACGLKFSRHPVSPRSAESSPRSHASPPDTPDG